MSGLSSAASETDDDPAPEEQESRQCPVSQCAEVVTGKWTLLVIRDLSIGPQYFSDLERSLAGISPRTLCARLDLLVTHGFVTRTRIKAIPPRTRYELTAAGEQLVPIVDAMRAAGLTLRGPEGRA